MGMGIGGAESMDRPSARALPPLNIKPKTNPEGFILPQVPETVIDGNNEDTRREFTFSKIYVTGNTVLPEAELRDLVRAYEGRKVNVAEIEELRQKITQLYIDKGYISSGAVIAPDAVSNGTLQISLIEGRLDEITIKGLGRLRESYVKSRLQDESDAPLNLKHLQDRFQLLLADPLISQMSGKLLPGPSSGQSILDLEVTRAKPYQLTLFGDNYRPPSIGAEAFGATGRVYNLSGLGDAFDFTVIQSEGAARYAGGFGVPLTPETLAFFHFDESRTLTLDPSLRSLDIKSQVHSLEGGFSQLVINQLNQQLDMGLLLAVRENATALGGEPFSFVPGVLTGRNQATVWRVYQNYTQRWERQALAFRSTFTIGMNALGATPKKANDLPSSEFFSWLGQAQYAYRVADDGSQMVLRGNLQLSDSPLLPLEQIALGGVGTVRGYRENHLVTDNAYHLSAEFHWPLSFGRDSKQRLTLIPFIDFGEAWNNADNPNGPQKQLFSAGLGFNWRYQPIALDLYYGYAINPAQPSNRGDLQDEAVHFQVRVDAL